MNFPKKCWVRQYLNKLISIKRFSVIRNYCVQTWTRNPTSNFFSSYLKLLGNHYENFDQIIFCPYGEVSNVVLSPLKHSVLLTKIADSSRSKYLKNSRTILELNTYFLKDLMFIQSISITLLVESVFSLCFQAHSHLASRK